jgi:anti-anti-sigma regulatory factor
LSAAVTTLGASLEIRDVDDIRGRLLDALDGATGLSVEVGAVTTADTAGVQLLLALKAEAAHRGMAVEFTGRSAALSRALAVLGLESAIAGMADHVE